MIPDLDIWRAAQLMVKRHGDDAAIQAGIGPTSYSLRATSTALRPGG
jgi:hypothetical protein